MSKYESALLEIKKILGLSSEVAKVELGSVKMADGTELKYDKLEVGGLVTIVSADGSESPLPAGTYELENNFALEVDDQGVITKYEEIKPAEEAEVAQEEVEQADQPAAPSGDVEAKLADLETRVAALEKAMTDALGLSADIAKSTQELSNKLEMSTDAKHIKRTSIEAKNELFDDSIRQITKTLKGLKK